MEDLGDRLAPGKGLKKIGMALCWTLLKKDVDILLSKIERLKTLVGLALHNDLLYAPGDFPDGHESLVAPVSSTWP